VVALTVSVFGVQVGICVWASGLGCWVVVVVVVGVGGGVGGLVVVVEVVG